MLMVIMICPGQSRSVSFPTRAILGDVHAVLYMGRSRGRGPGYKAPISPGLFIKRSLDISQLDENAKRSREDEKT